MEAVERGRVLRVDGSLEELVERRRRLIGVLRGFEECYGLSTRGFVEAWRSGGLPEPEDPDTLRDFLAWETTYEMLTRVEERLRRLVR